MKAIVVHLINKYPGGRVVPSGSSINVYDANGYHRVALAKDGNGDLRDVGSEVGALDKFDLSPLPKECRYMKLHADGRVAPAEEHDDRRPKALQLASKFGGMVPSIKELEAAGIQA